MSSRASGRDAPNGAESEVMSMANKNLFRTLAGKLAPPATAVNEAGGPAYALPPKAALAQYAATGCLNGTYYAGADEQLDAVLGLCARVEPAFIARTASSLTSTGAGIPGTSAVVITTSLSPTCGTSSSTCRRCRSSSSAAAYPPVPSAPVVSSSSFTNFAPTDSTCSAAAARTS